MMQDTNVNAFSEPTTKLWGCAELNDAVCGLAWLLIDNGMNEHATSDCLLGYLLAAIEPQLKDIPRKVAVLTAVKRGLGQPSAQ